jgi:PadR family transcriptional regulator, regulatory protein PadR
VAEAAAGEAKRLAEASDAQFAPAGRPSDVFGGDLPLKGAEGGPRRRDIFTILILHLISNSETGASYGNQLIDRIAEITAGTVSLNPNTMYPLLRKLEAEGLIEGRWEHPEKRSRRLYSVTAAGTEEYQQLRSALEPFLDSIVRSITLIKLEIYGPSAAAAG